MTHTPAHAYVTWIKCLYNEKRKTVAWRIVEIVTDKIDDRNIPFYLPIYIEIFVYTNVSASVLLLFPFSLTRIDFSTPAVIFIVCLQNEKTKNKRKENSNTATMNTKIHLAFWQRYFILSKQSRMQTGLYFRLVAIFLSVSLLFFLSGYVCLSIFHFFGFFVFFWIFMWVCGLCICLLYCFVLTLCLNV